jgi:hypothetical protein
MIFNKGNRSPVKSSPSLPMPMAPPKKGPVEQFIFSEALCISWAATTAVRHFEMVDTNPRVAGDGNSQPAHSKSEVDFFALGGTPKPGREKAPTTDAVHGKQAKPAREKRDRTVGCLGIIGHYFAGKSIDKADNSGIVTWQGSGRGDGFRNIGLRDTASPNHFRASDGGPSQLRQ